MKIRPWMPLALGAGLLAWLGLRRPAAGRRVGVTTWIHRHLEPGFFEAVAAVKTDFVSLKLLNGSTLSTESAPDTQLAQIAAAGARPWVWSYHYCRTPAEATAEATAAAREINRRLAQGHRIEAYCLDLENEWTGTGKNSKGEMYPVTANPEAQAIRFIETFHGLCPSVPVWWNGLSYKFSDFNVNNGRGPRVELFSGNVARAIAATGGGYHPQCYFFNRRTAQSAVNGIAARVQKHSDIFPREKRAALLGTQRLDKDGQPAGLWFNAEKTGDCDLLAPHADIVSSFYGSGSGGRMVGSVEQNPPLAELMRAWKELPR
jgi:hypothetical protein